METSKTPSVSERLREAIRASGLSQRQLALRSGVDEAVLSRFRHRKAGLNLESVDKLAAALGLDLVPVRPARPACR